MSPTEQSLSISFVCNTSVQANGGVAAYERFLSRKLSDGNRVSAISRFIQNPPPGTNYVDADPAQVLDCGGYKNWVIESRRFYRPFLRRMLALTTRPRLHPLAIGLFDRAFGPQLDAVMPRDTDVVHYTGNGWELLGFSALKAARNRGAVFAMTPFVHPRLWGDSALDVRLYNSADAVFVVSNFERDYLRSLGVAESRLKLTGLAPASEFIGDGERFRRKHGMVGRRIILFVGRRQKYKGYHVLRQAMARASQKFPDACLVVIGPDLEPPYPELPPYNVLDLGSLSWNDVDQQEKADALAACDVFAMPSEGEAFGIVYVEAWEYAKPVIGGPAPAVREMINDNVNGYFVQQTAASVGDALEKLLADRNLRQLLGANGQAMQRERFTWGEITRFHRRIFQELIEQCRVTRSAGR